MKVLFVHQNYPGQFRHLAPALAARGDKVSALSCRYDRPTIIDDVRVEPYRLPCKPGNAALCSVQDFERQLHYGYATAAKALRGKKAGYTPDVIVGHPSWGETLFLKHIWPRTPLGLYCELFFDPAHPASWPATALPEGYRLPLKKRLSLRLRNVNTRLHEDIMDAGISPTQFQRDSYPEALRARITRQHEGVDTDVSCPDPDARFTLPNGANLTRADEVITYAARALEPMRGFDVLSQALPALLRARPKAQIIIVGREDCSYSPTRGDGLSWKQHFMSRVSDAIGEEHRGRLHFLGTLPHAQFRSLLQVSRVHIYLTYPFVVSWSLLEALSTGCAVVASDGPSVREVVKSPTQAELVPFPDPKALVQAVTSLCDNPARRSAMAKAARAHVVQNYDLNRVCLPAQIEWVDRLATLTPRAPLD